MADALRVTIDVIVHATEDGTKILEAFEKFGVAGQEFSPRHATGHYDNPITILRAELQKARAQDFVGRLFGAMSMSQRETLAGQADTRIADSKFHLRLGKQGFLGGRLDLEDGDAIRIIVRTASYGKGEAGRGFRGMILGTRHDAPVSGRKP